jgi:hypothetical protein
MTIRPSPTAAFTMLELLYQGAVRHAKRTAPLHDLLLPFEPTVRQSYPATRPFCLPRAKEPVHGVPSNGSK